MKRVSILKCRLKATRSCSNIKMMTQLAGVLIALFPILAPYSVGVFRLNWILGALFVVLGLYKGLNPADLFSKKCWMKPLICYTLISWLLSINGFYVLENASQLLNAEIAVVAELVVYVVLWHYSDIERTVKYANLFGYVCCGYAIFQMLMSITGNTVPLGKLPLLDISTEWVEDVWGFRFNSLFSEPSYFAIYLLPIFLYNFLNKRWVNSAVFGISILLSSSSLGIIAMCVVVLLHLISTGRKKKLEKRTLIIIVAVLGVFILLITVVPAFNRLVSRSFRKIGEIFTSILDGSIKENIRLFGYGYMFEDLPLKEQLLGVGNAQLQNYFAERGVSVYNYSNSFVLSLLNFGVIGLIVFLAFIGNVFRWSYKNKTILFFLILFLALAVDSLLFSYRYYWLLYFVFFATTKLEAE